MRSLENTGIFLKEITRKVNIHEGGFLNFYKPLMSVGLPSKKKCTCVLNPVAKSFLILLGLTAAASATYAAIQKKIFDQGILRT